MNQLMTGYVDVKCIINRLNAKIWIERYGISQFCDSFESWQIAAGIIIKNLVIKHCALAYWEFR